MRKIFGIILCSIILVAITLLNPGHGMAISASGPTPIPGNLFPTPDNSSAPIIPTNSSSSESTPVTQTQNLTTTNSVSSTLQNSLTAAPLLYTISKTQSGLVVEDPLNNQTSNQQQLLTNSKYWILGGDAPAENATYSLKENKGGLHIGVASPSNGTWAGFYATSPNTNATLFHAIVTTPVRTIPFQYYENGFYIQTSQPLINYVTCISVTSASGTIWAIVSTGGDANQANQFHILWVDTSPNQPLTRDCSIVTNGNNMLKVYLDHFLVYSNDTLALDIPSPFNSYLEPETSYPGDMLKGTFTNYFATTNENMTVGNNPVNGTVDLVSSKGAVLASAPVDSAGTATFNMALYAEPMTAYIKAYDANSTLVASTPSAVAIWGGDAYSVNR